MKLKFNLRNYLYPQKYLTKKYFLILLSMTGLAVLMLAGYTLYDLRLSPEEKLAMLQKKEIAGDLKRFDDNKLNPDSSAQEVYEYHIARSTYLAQLGKNEEALEELKKAATSGAELKYGYYISLGVAYQALGNKSEAKDAYEKALAKVEAGGETDPEAKRSIVNGIKARIEGLNQ